MDENERVVKPDQCWRLGDESQPGWFVQEVDRIPGKALLARWADTGEERVRHERVVDVASLLAGDGGWVQLTGEREERERAAQGELTHAQSYVDRVRALVARNPTPEEQRAAGAPVAADRFVDPGCRGCGARPAEEHRDDCPVYLANLRRDVEREKALGVSQAQRFSDARKPGELARELLAVFAWWRENGDELAYLVQRAADRLDEAAGPVFAAWRCDACDAVVPDELLWAVESSRRVRIVYRDDNTHVSYVECTHGGQEHGPMRHAECRVTPNEPTTKG